MTESATTTDNIHHSSKEAEYDEPSNGRWTREEHLNFIKGLELHGKGWKKIAALIKTRTVVQIRTHAQKYFLKLQKARNESQGKIQAENKAKDVNRKTKIKRAEGDHFPSYARPQVIFHNKEDTGSSLYNFLTPNYPADLTIETCDFYQKGHGVDTLIRDAEALDWSQESAIIEAAAAAKTAHENARSYQHASPKSFTNVDYYPFNGSTVPPPSNSSGEQQQSHSNGYSAQFDFNFTYPSQQGGFMQDKVAHFMDDPLQTLLDPLHVIGTALPVDHEHDVWLKNAFHEGLRSTEEDIGLYFQD